MKPGTFLSLLLVFALVVPVLAASKQVSDDVLTDSVRRKLANDQIVKGGAIASACPDPINGATRVRPAINRAHRRTLIAHLRVDLEAHHAARKRAADSMTGPSPRSGRQLV